MKQVKCNHCGQETTRQPEGDVCHNCGKGIMEMALAALRERIGE